MNIRVPAAGYLEAAKETQVKTAIAICGPVSRLPRSDAKCLRHLATGCQHCLSIREIRVIPESECAASLRAVTRPSEVNGAAVPVPGKSGNEQRHVAARDWRAHYLPSDLPSSAGSSNAATRTSISSISIACFAWPRTLSAARTCTECGAAGSTYRILRKADGLYVTAAQ